MSGAHSARDDDLPPFARCSLAGLLTTRKSFAGNHLGGRRFTVIGNKAWSELGKSVRETTSETPMPESRISVSATPSHAPDELMAPWKALGLREMSALIGRKLARTAKPPRQRCESCNGRVQCNTAARGLLPRPLRIYWPGSPLVGFVESSQARLGHT